MGLSTTDGGQYGASREPTPSSGSDDTRRTLGFALRPAAPGACTMSAFSRGAAAAAAPGACTMSGLSSSWSSPSPAASPPKSAAASPRAAAASALGPEESASEPTVSRRT